MSSPAISEVNPLDNAIETLNKDCNPIEFHDKSLIIEYPDYRMLIIDTGLLEKHKQPDILSTIDIIVVLQWNSRIQTILDILFTEVIQEDFQFKSFCCLILPNIIDLLNPIRMNSTSNKLSRYWLTKDDEKKYPMMKWLRSALKHGLTVLQICSNNKFWTRFHCSQPTSSVTNSSLPSTIDEKIYLTVFNNHLQKINLTTGVQKSSLLLLFEKFGLGKLKMMAIPSGSVGDSGLSYSLLLVWLPYECENSLPNDTKRTAAKVFFYPVTLEAKMNAADEQKSQIEEVKVKRDAILATRSLMQQLIRYNSNTNSPIYRKRQFYRDANSSSTITRSKTFTSGLNPLPRVKCSNGGHSVINPILRKSFEQKNEDDSIRSPINNDKKDEIGSKQVTCHKTVKFGPIEECHYQGKKKITTKILTNENYSKTTTSASITENTSTNLDIPENSNSTQNSPVINPEVIVKSNEDSDEKQEILLTKSTSFPNQLVQHTLAADQNRSSCSSAISDQCSDYQSCNHYYYYYCNDHQNYDQFPPLSATVLLAIPEIGENDYYADSPQCLTVKELRELGVYTSEEDDDDDEEEDDGDGVVDNNNNNTTNDDDGDDDEDVVGKSKEVLDSIREQREYRLDTNERISSSPTYIHGTDILVVSHTPSTTSEFNEIHASHHHQHHHHEEVMI